MSVNQIKKAAAALRTHLHKDETGQSLLAALVREVTDLRATSATQAERLETVERIANQNRDLKVEAYATNERLRLENKRIASSARQLSLSASAMELELSKERGENHVPFSSGNLTEDLTAGRFYKWARKTGRELGRLGKPTRCTTPYPEGYTFDEILPSLDERGFATLGRVVLLKTLIDGAVCVFLPELISDPEQIIKALCRDSDWEKAASMWIDVFAKSIDNGNKSENDRLQKLTSGRCNWGDNKYPSSSNTTADIFGDD